MFVGKPQRALPPHASSQQSNLRWLAVPAGGNVRHHLVQHVVFGGYRGVKFLADTVGPPAPLGNRTYNPQAMPIELPTKFRLTAQLLQVQAMQVDYHIGMLGWV